MAASPYAVDPEGSVTTDPTKSRAVSVRDVSMRAPSSTELATSQRGVVPNSGGNYRPNFTFQPNLNTLEPPARLGYTPPPQGAPGPIPSYQDRGLMQPDASVGERARARTAGIGAAPPVTPEPLSSATAPKTAAAGLRGFASSVGSAAKSLVPSLLGNVVGRTGNMLAEAGVGDSAPVGIPADPQYTTRVASIPGAAPGDVAPPAQAPNFFRDNEVGRNIANTSNALAGATGLGAVGFKSTSNATQLGLRESGLGASIIPKAITANEGFALGTQAKPGLPGFPASGASSAQASTPAAPSTEPAGPLMGTNGPQQPTVQRVNAPGQNPLFTDGSKGDGLRLGVVPGYGDEARAIDDRTSAIYASMRDTQRQLDAYGPGGQGGGGAAGIDGARTARETNAATERSQAMDDIKRLAGSRGRGAAAAISALANSDSTSSAERIAGMREQGETSRANATNAISMRGQDVQASNNLRTTETQRFGHEQSARAAADAARREQGNKDRAYRMDVEKFGAERAEKNRAANESAIKSQQTRLENRFRTSDASGKDVPDTAKIADFHTAVDATLPALIKELRASSKPGAAAKAKELEDRGRAALDDTALDEITQLYERRDLGRQGNGWMPGTGNFVDSPNLLDFRQRGGGEGIDKRFIGSDAVVLENGTRINTNSVRSGKASNAYNPNFFGDETSQYSRGLRGN